MGIHKKLMEARVKLHSSSMKKTGRNAFAKYDYFELGDFLPQAIKILADLNVCGYVSFDNEIAKLRLIDIEDNSEIVITSPMRSAELKGAHEIQNLGAVETYQRRYLWMAAFEIVEHDMLDSSQPIDSKKKDEPKGKKVLTPANKPLWENAKNAYKRDGNLEKVLEKVMISPEHQTLLMEECENEAVVS